MNEGCKCMDASVDGSLDFKKGISLHHVQQERAADGNMTQIT